MGFVIRMISNVVCGTIKGVDTVVFDGYRAVQNTETYATIKKAADKAKEEAAKLAASKTK